MSASGPPTGEYTFIIERPQEASPQRKRPRTLTACDKWSVFSPSPRPPESTSTPLTAVPAPAPAACAKSSATPSPIPASASRVRPGASSAPSKSALAARSRVSTSSMQPRNPSQRLRRPQRPRQCPRRGHPLSAIAPSPFLRTATATASSNDLLLHDPV